MGNDQPLPLNYTQTGQQPPYFMGANPVTAFPATHGTITPQIYSTGSSQNCDCCNPTAPLPGFGSTPGLGYNPGYVNMQYGNLQQSPDQFCCGPDMTVVPPLQPSQQIITRQATTTQVVPAVRTSLVNSTIYTPIATDTFIADPIRSSIIQTEVFRPAVPVVAQINPFANLPARIASVIQTLGSVNPLRGSIMNRLQTPQYVPEKQAYYQGQWINGYMNGFGRLYFDSGAYFEGQFSNGLAQTLHGLFIYPDGSYYIGGVDRNVANGQGQFNYRGGRLIYKGQFLNDQPDGHGLELYSDGSKYEGGFRFGKKEGRGQFVWKDGTFYTGQFENGFMQGQGVHNLSNGQIYEGEFRKNKRHGRGKHVTSLGTYIGGFKRDKKEGTGQFIWADGKIFKGTFHDGKPDGPGSMTVADGSIVYGIWINGVLDQTSLTSVNPNRGSQIVPSVIRASNVSVGSIGSIQNGQIGSGIIRTSQITPGPPILNLTGGMLAGGFIGQASPFVNQRGSIVSVVGPSGDWRGGLSIPRGSNVMTRISPSPVLRTSSFSPIPRGSNVIINPISTVPLVNAPIMRTSIVGTNINPISTIIPGAPAIVRTPSSLIAGSGSFGSSLTGLRSSIVVQGLVPSSISGGSTLIQPSPFVSPPVLTPTIVTPPIITPAPITATYGINNINSLNAPIVSGIGRNSIVTTGLPGLNPFGVNPMVQRNLPSVSPVRVSTVSAGYRSVSPVPSSILGRPPVLSPLVGNPGFLQ